MPTTKNQGPNLTNFTYMGRQAVKFGVILIVVLIVGRTFLSAFISFWQAIHPEPPPPPTVGFGVLPTISFPKQTSDQKPTSYKLETATGGLPSFGDRAKVFFMPPSSLSLLSDATTKKIASDLGFIFEPGITSNRIYRFTKTGELNSTLQIDAQTYQFNLKTDYLSHPELLSSNNLPDNFKAVTLVKNLLSKVDLLGEDMATAGGEVVYKKSAGGELIQAVSFSDADFLEVDLNRTPIDGIYRMYTPNGYQGIVHAVVMGALSGNNNIVHLENNYRQVDYTQYHTYPLRDVAQAWKILQNGEGYIADQGETDQAVVRKVSLAYFDNFEEQTYLQPIYVFSGDNDFLGFVSAIDPEWVR